MLVEWSAECSADDPVLVVPWRDPDGTAVFIDLRSNPYDLDHIREAVEHPPLMQALRAFNATRSPVFTAKCDAWLLSEEDRSALQLELDLSVEDAACGFASYIDLLWRDRSIFASFHQVEQMMRRLERLAATLEHPAAMLDCVLRPALVDLEGAQEGYAASLYVKALGPDPPSATRNWAAALEASVALLRGGDFKR